MHAVADPGFSVAGGPDLLGGANLRRVCFSVKTNAKTKELDPVGRGGARGAPPGSANGMDCRTQMYWEFQAPFW